MDSKLDSSADVRRAFALTLLVAALVLPLAAPHEAEASGGEGGAAAETQGPARIVATTGIADRVSWWRGEGNTFDATGGNDGTSESGLGYTTGSTGEAFEFDGIDDTLTVVDDGSLDLTDGVTIAAWVRMESCTFLYGWCAIVGKSVDGFAVHFNYGLVVSGGGQFSFIGGDGSSYLLDYRGPDLRNSGWRHLAVTYDETTVRYYLDGSQIHAAAASVPLTANSAALQIGSLDDWSGDAAEFGGDIDEVMLFRRALTPTEIRELATDFSPLVAGVVEVGTPYQVSSLVAADTGWVGIVGGDVDSSLSATIVAARGLGAGRVVAMQANGLGISLGSLDNLVLFDNVSNWLRHGGGKTLGYLTGHGEVVEGEWITAWQNDGFVVSAIPAPLTASSFSGKSVVVVGHNLASGDLYQPSELAALLDFVAAGGGLYQVALGWPNASYGAGRQLADQFGIWFVSDAIADPTNNFGTEQTPKFHTFHPAVDLPGILYAQEVIEASHAENQDSWTVAMDDAGARRRYLRALRGIDLLGLAAPPNAGVRDSIHSFFLGLFDEVANPGAAAALGRSLRYDPAVDSMAGYVREYFLKTWFDSIRPEARADLATLAELSPSQSALVTQVPVIVLDNAGLDADQSQFLEDLFTLVPSALHRIRDLSFVDLIRDPATAWPGLPPELGWSDFHAQRPGDGAANSFSSAIGAATGNPFSPEVPPYASDLFTGALVHELNHGIDATSAYGVPALAERRAALLARAGCDHLDFLRSVLEDCWFQSNPGEFVASMSNIFGVYTERTLDVALDRMGAGRNEPMNQFLFMLELYSGGGDHSYFWKVNSEVPPATVQRWTVPLARNPDGYIQSFDWSGERYSFTLDPGGWVIGLSVVALPSIFADDFEDGGVSAWSSNIGYTP